MRTLLLPDVVAPLIGVQNSTLERFAKKYLLQYNMLHGNALQPVAV